MHLNYEKLANMHQHQGSLVLDVDGISPTRRTAEDFDVEPLIVYATTCGLRL